MKPWNCESFRTTCANCGAGGWNYEAHLAWLGVPFVCQGGCDPARVRAYQAEQMLRRAEALRRRQEGAADYVI